MIFEVNDEKLSVIAGMLAAAVMIAAAVRFSPERAGEEANSEAAPLPVLSLTIDSGEQP